MVSLVLSILTFFCVLGILLLRRTQWKITAGWVSGILISILFVSLNLEYLAFLEFALASIQLVVFLQFFHLLRSLETAKDAESRILRSRWIFWALFSMHLLLAFLFALYFHARFFATAGTGLDSVSALQIGTALVEQYQPIMVILSLLFIISALAIGVISSIRSTAGGEDG